MKNKMVVHPFLNMEYSSENKLFFSCRMRTLSPFHQIELIFLFNCLCSFEHNIRSFEWCYG